MEQIDFTSGETARDLRLEIADHAAREAEEAIARHAREAAETAETIFALRHHRLSGAEYRSIIEDVLHAAEAGRFSATVMTFPAHICTDHGRAILNDSAHWAETLPLKPRSFYDHWSRVERAMGYRLFATVLSFPDGLPGDIGLALDWHPPQGAAVLMQDHA